MAINYRLDDALSSEIKPEPEPNWRSMYEGADVMAKYWKERCEANEFFIGKLALAVDLQKIRDMVDDHSEYIATSFIGG